MRNEQIYYLMHKNDIVTTLSFDETSGTLMNVGKKVNKELLPPGANLSEKSLRQWWERRAVPLNQGNIKMLLSENQIATTQNYLLQNLGLSLSDHYWINPVEKNYRWEDINLFTNDFKDEIGEFRFKDSISDERKMMDLRNKTIFYPSASLQGELQKKWLLQNGKRYLIKGNYGNSSQQSINEAIATLLHKKQRKMPFTEYRLCEIIVSGAAGIGCVCEDFCTEDIEFIPAYDVVNSAKKKNDQSEYEHFISICEGQGLEEETVRGFLEYQILSDFVLTNTDRHFYNFGVLRDSCSLKFIGMAPIFDSGNSMFWNYISVPRGQALLDIPVNSFKGREVDLLRYVEHAALIDLDRLPSKEAVKELLELDEVCKGRAEDILMGYMKKIDLLERFERGEKIYRYGYCV